jgi:glycosyltransferase involved in cell wall biosynthesis
MESALPRGEGIAVIVPLPPSYRGGTEEYAYRLVRRFADRMPVRLLTTTVRWNPEGDLLDVGSATLEFLSGREIFQRPLVVGPAARHRLREAVRASTLVQLHMPFPWVERRVTAWARAAGVPTVLTYHMDAEFGAASTAPGSGAVTRLYRRLSALPAVRACSAVVSNSRGYAEGSPVLSRVLPKVRVVHKGVDPQRLGLGGPIRSGRAEPGAELLPDSAPDRKRVLFVGRLVPYKGVPVLLEAFARLAARRPDVDLYIAGRGPLRDDLERKAEALGVAPRVHFLGFVPDLRLGELYRSADVIACPSVSRLESTPTSLEEGASCGTPVLGSAFPGTQETVPNDGIRGILVPPGDVAAVVEGLDRLLDQPRPGPPTGLRTWDDTAREYLALFQELTEGRLRPAEDSRRSESRPEALPPAGSGFRRNYTAQQAFKP